MSYIDDHHDDEMNELYLNKKHINSINQTEFIKILPAYVGCEITGDIIVKGSTFSCLMPEEDTYFTLYTEHTEYGQIRYKKRTLDSIKLVLRKLEDLTFDEYITWCSGIVENLNLKALKEFYLEIILMAKKGVDNFMVNSSWSITDCAGFIRYLISIGIDCDGILQSEFGVRKTQ